MLSVFSPTSRPVSADSVGKEREVAAGSVTICLLFCISPPSQLSGLTLKMIWKKLKHREGEVEPDLASLFFPRASWRGNGGGGWACCWMPSLLPCLSPVPSCFSYLHGMHTSVAAHFLSGNWNLFHHFTISPSMFISPALLRVCLESLDHTETISCWRIRPGLENSAKFYAGQSFEKVVSFSASGWVCLW